MKEAVHGGHKKAAILIDGLQFLGPLSYKHVFGKPLFAYICILQVKNLAAVLRFVCPLKLPQLSLIFCKVNDIVDKKPSSPVSMRAQYAL